MQSRVFTKSDQDMFVRLSGDYNPLHTDPVLARRLTFGKQVVHGVHLLLWGLGCLLESISEHIVLRKLQAKFLKPVGLNERVKCQLIMVSPEKVYLELRASNETVLTAEIEFQREKNLHYLNEYEPKSILYDNTGCAVINSENISKVEGSLELALHQETTLKLFVYVAKFLPSVQVAEILSADRIFGMKCPGLHSVVSGLQMEFGNLEPGELTMQYKVVNYDGRFNLATVKIVSPGAEGVITGFLRPIPSVQSSIEKVQEKVDSTSFSGQVALIVGGSRGLGEITAKMLAAGGAKVYLTYATGRQDAEKIVNDLEMSGLQADCFSLDILSDETELDRTISQKCHDISHIYYFCSPFIGSAPKGLFRNEVFMRFCDYYVSGFNKLFKITANKGIKNYFYPSTVFLSEQPLNMGEYTAAKAAGESLCSLLSKSVESINILNPRLPKLATDQTVSVIGKRIDSPDAIMLNQLNQFHKLGMKNIYA
jgi:hypothetical protein